MRLDRSIESNVWDYWDFRIEVINKIFGSICFALRVRVQRKKGCPIYADAHRNNRTHIERYTSMTLYSILPILYVPATTQTNANNNNLSQFHALIFWSAKKYCFWNCGGIIVIYLFVLLMYCKSINIRF